MKLQSVSRLNWNLEMLVFVEGQNLAETLEETLGAGMKTNNKLNTHMASTPGIDSRPQRGEGCAFTITSSLLPRWYGVTLKLADNWLLKVQS